MSVADWIGTIGVSLLLIAFGLNLLKIITAESYVYLFLNFFGALLAGLASVLINYIPFVILETVWMCVTLIAIIKKLNQKSTNG
jgi:hypothetical protein